MAVDLLALRAECHAIAPDNGDELFWRRVQAGARDDLLCYGLWVHGHEAPILARVATARHVLEWANFMEQHLQTLIVAPPEHAKTVVHRWYTEWWLGRQTELHFRGDDVPTPSALFVMNAADQAEEQCMTIAATIESNPRYRRLFPHAEPDVPWGWTKSKLFLKRRAPNPNPSLMCTGIFGPIQGKRFGMRVVDDPTDQEDAYSPDTLTKQIARHQGSLADRMLKGAPQRDIMTRWSENDIPAQLAKSSRWKTLTMPVLGYWDGLGAEGEPLWPEEFSKDRLEQIKNEKRLARELTSDLWQLAWLCAPVQQGGNFFQTLHFQYGWPAGVPQPRKVAVA